MTRTTGTGLLAFVVFWGLISGSACRRTVEKSDTRAASSTTPPRTEPDTAASQAGDQPDEGSAKTEPSHSDPSKDRGKGAEPAGAAQETGSAEAVEQAGPAGPAGATDVPPKPTPPDPNPTPIDGLEMVVTKSGLKYWDIRVGEGETPEPNAKVKLNWRAWFTDGKLFDSSAAKGFAPVYQRTGVIPGLYEGVWSMRVGGIRRIEVPPDLGYGAPGKPPLVPPNATLIFEVELLETTPRRKPQPYEHLSAVTKPSGLKYWELKVGDGEQPKPRCIVEMHYAVWADDGTLIADTLETVIPPPIPLNRLPPGWLEGVSDMRVGGTRRLEIPAELGYGTQGRPFVPDNVGLVIEVELLSVKPSEPGPRPPSVEGIEPVVAPSGLVYWDIRKGHGRQPGADGPVLVHFTAWLSDGTMYESSREHDVPIILELDRELAGLAEGIRTMRIGGQRQLKVPPKLAYGEKGRPGLIPPNETLTMEVELLGFSE